MGDSEDFLSSLWSTATSTCLVYAFANATLATKHLNESKDVNTDKHYSVMGYDFKMQQSKRQ